MQSADASVGLVYIFHAIRGARVLFEDEFKIHIGLQFIGYPRVELLFDRAFKEYARSS